MRLPRSRFTVQALITLVALVRPVSAQDREPLRRRVERTDLYGDPLPRGAVARIGTVRDNFGFKTGDIVLSPDGKTVTATSSFWLLPLRLWDVETGRLLRELTELDPRYFPGVLGGHARRVAFSPDGKLIAAGDDEGTVRIGRTDTGRKVLELTGHEGFISKVRFSSDGKTLAVVDETEDAWLWEVETGEKLRRLTVGGNTFGGVLSPDGKTFAARRSDGIVTIRDLITGREVRRLEQYRLTGEQGRRGHFPLLRVLQPLAFSADGKLLACADRGRGLEVLDVSSGREVARFLRPARRLRRAESGMICEDREPHFEFSPDGRYLAATETPESLCLWDLATGHPYRRLLHMSADSGFAFTPDGKRLVSGGTYLHLWDIARSNEVRRLPRLGQVTAAYGPDGKTLATADGATLRLWDAATGREVRRIDGHEDLIASVAIAPDGKTVACGDMGGTLGLWDVATGGVARRFPEHEGRVHSVTFSPDGKTLAAGDDSGARVWDVATGGEVHRFPGFPEGRIRHLSYSPDGTTLAVADDQGVTLRDLATGRMKKSFDRGIIFSLAFSPDGKTLATGEDEGVVGLWDVATGQRVRQLGGGPNPDQLVMPVRLLAFTPDGKAVAAQGTHFDVRLWDIVTGKEARRLRGHINSVNSIAISPDGKTLATGSDDGTALVWDLATIGKD